MEIRQTDSSVSRVADIDEITSSMRRLSDDAINRIFLEFSRLASKIGASVPQANDFAAVSTFAYSAALGMVQRDANTLLAVKSIIAERIITSELVEGLEAAKGMDMKSIAFSITNAREISEIMLNKTRKELDRAQISDYITRILGALSNAGTGGAGAKLRKLFRLIEQERRGFPEETLDTLDRMSMHRGLNQNFMCFMSDMYIYASNPLKIALLATVRDNPGLGSYWSIIDEAKKRFGVLDQVKAETLHATLKRDRGICGIRCIGKADGGYVANADVWALAAWAAARGFGMLDGIAKAEGADIATVNALLGVETRSQTPHSLSLYAILDALSSSGFSTLGRNEFMKTAEKRGWNVDLKHALYMLSKSGVMTYIDKYDKSGTLDPNRDIRYRVPNGSIGDEGIAALAKARPYIKGVIPKVVMAINAADNKEGFSIYDIHKDSGAFLQGVEKAMHGLAEMGLLVKDQQEYMIMPKTAARIAWEGFFKPLGNIATYVACDGNVSHGIIGAGVICRMDKEGTYDKEHSDGALDAMIRRYAEAEMKKMFRNGENGGNGGNDGNSPRGLVMRAMEGSTGLTKRQILEGVSAYDDRMNEDRLSWYLLQLRREGKISMVDGRYRHTNLSAF